MYIILDKYYNNNFGKYGLFEDLTLALEIVKMLNQILGNKFKIFELKEIK